MIISEKFLLKQMHERKADFTVTSNYKGQKQYCTTKRVFFSFSEEVGGGGGHSS